MIDIDKMNDCSLASLLNPNAEAINNMGWLQIHKFVSSHWTKEEAELLKNVKIPKHCITNAKTKKEIVGMLINDMHNQIFPKIEATQ